MNPSPGSTAPRATDDVACEARCVDPGGIRTARTAIGGRDLATSASLFNALGDLTRLRLLTALLESPLCTCDLASVLGVTDSAVSHQLRVLKELRLVASRREGRIVYHELAGGHVRRFIEGVRGHVRDLAALS